MSAALAPRNSELDALLQGVVGQDDCKVSLDPMAGQSLYFGGIASKNMSAIGSRTQLHVAPLSLLYVDVMGITQDSRFLDCIFPHSCISACNGTTVRCAEGHDG